MRNDFANEGQETRFLPGQSGNNNGRPKGPITQFLREFGDADELIFDITKVKDGQVSHSSAKLSTGGQSINQAIAARLLQMALGGDIKAIREVLNRTEGRVPLPLNIRRDATAGAELKTWTAEEIDRYEAWQAAVQQVTSEMAETVAFEDINNEEETDPNAD